MLFVDVLWVFFEGHAKKNGRRAVVLEFFQLWGVVAMILRICK
jgi:hypothetical protein